MRLTFIVLKSIFSAGTYRKGLQKRPDTDLIPLAMQMYLGNELEKPNIRKIIKEMKQCCKVSGRTIQVAVKE